MRITAQGTNLEISAGELDFLKNYAPEETFRAVMKFIEHALSITGAKESTKPFKGKEPL
jgi:hypothetical protein